MELTDLKENFDELPKEQAKAILNIIEHKTDNDMKEVISEIKSVKELMRNEIKIVYWVIGLAFTIIAILIAVLALKK